jgi:UPF0271 protein
MAAADPSLAEAIARAVYKVNPALVLYGLSGSELIKAGEKIGLATASEVFSDRTYQPDGTLTSRSRPDALITDDEKAVGQVIRMVKEQKVLSLSGEEISIQADTICIHGDGAHALSFAQKIREAFEAANITAKSVR